jgi:phosphoglycolate phosphatase-like HAD superfamily hydrolase
MYPPRAIFVGLHGVLVDAARYADQVPAALAAILSERYGGSAAIWQRAYARVVADWDSYYADLHLSDSDDGIADMWEGAFRTTRAIFRLASVPEPPSSELTTLAHSLSGDAAARCDLIAPHAKRALIRLYDDGSDLGITTHAPLCYARGVIAGAGMAAYVSEALIIAPDCIDHFERDAVHYAAAARRAGGDPAACWVIDCAADALAGARAAGLQALPFSGWDQLGISR